LIGGIYLDVGVDATKKSNYEMARGWKLVV
jgi:hypothetical protein